MCETILLWSRRTMINVIITCVILIHMKLKNDINDIKFCHQIIINEV